MFIGKYCALCKITSHNSFIEDFGPLAYLSKELCDNLVFLKPYLCDLVIGKKRYEFNVLPLIDEAGKKNGVENIFYSDHEISVPYEYLELALEKKVEWGRVRTDLF